MVKVWTDSLAKIYDDPEFKKYYRENMLVPRFVPAEKMQKVMDDQHAFFKEMGKGLY